MKKANLMLMFTLVLCVSTVGLAQKGNRGSGRGIVIGREERTERHGAEGREERGRNLGNFNRNRGIGREERTEKRGLEALEERNRRSRGHFKHRHRHEHFDMGVRRRRRVVRRHRH